MNPNDAFRIVGKCEVRSEKFENVALGWRGQMSPGVNRVRRRVASEND